jgi:hypothetical protein
MMRFDVHRAAYPIAALGEFLVTIEAPDHRRAKDQAQRDRPGVSVVVVPHRKPNEKLERAVARLRPRPPRTKGDFRARNASAPKRGAA